MSSISANGIQIEYESFGAPDAEAMLLISGMGVQLTRWPTGFCERLAARGYRVIRFDNRDAGLSTAFAGEGMPDVHGIAAAMARGESPAVPYTLHDMARDAIGLLDALNIERAHIAGRSMGGMIGQLVAASYPGRVRSLVPIMSSTGNPALPPPTPEALATLLRRPPDPFADEAAYLDHAVAVAKTIGSPGYPFDAGAWRALALADLRRAWNPTGAARHMAAIVASGDLRGRLASITAPALVIHGMADPVFRPECGRDIAATIRGATLLMIEGMGHDVPPELYDTVIDAMVRNARAA
jgi:pimeloyl-ACP methyl ester carboxylesterase